MHHHEFMAITGQTNIDVDDYFLQEVAGGKNEYP